MLLWSSRLERLPSDLHDVADTNTVRSKNDSTLYFSIAHIDDLHHRSMDDAQTGTTRIAF